MNDLTSNVNIMHAAMEAVILKRC